jgi:hypothetical protein
MDDRHELDALRAAVAALRDEVAAMRPAAPRDALLTRRGLLLGFAGTGVASVATTAQTSPAGADDGDNLVLGIENSATSTTLVQAVTDDGITNVAIGEPLFGLAAYTERADGEGVPRSALTGQIPPGELARCVGPGSGFTGSSGTSPSCHRVTGGVRCSQTRQRLLEHVRDQLHEG